ncbi:MAG: trigger factor [Ruminococcus sp.]|jgi:trigger factor|nr:trigger factor [Ruminococcus sp.]
MGLVETNKIDTNKYEFIVDVNPERFEKAVNDSYVKARNRIQINGFRKGKAPRKMIEKIYGEQCFYEDAVNLLIRQEVNPAMLTSEVELVAPPEVSVEQIGKATGVKFKLTGFAKPEINDINYKGIAVTRTVEPVTDADIDADLDDLRHKSARIITVEDRSSQMGDTLVIDFTGYKDGVAFDGGSETKYSLKLGSSMFIPGFEEQCVGKKAGDTFNIDVTFPENYQMTELAGQPAVFEIVVHEVQAEELPDLDDDFVKDISDFNDLDELKADIKTKRLESAEQAADAKAEDDIFKVVADQVKAEIPEVMLEQKIDDYMKEFEYRVQMQGFDLDTYCAFTGNSIESLREGNREKAETQVKLRLALEYIAKVEDVQISDEQVEEELKKMADSYRMSVDKVRSVVNQKVLKLDLMCAEASKIVKDAAVVV